jgi:tRNA-dihydrouridine synthase B
VGVQIARKHISWYSRGLPGSAEFRSAVNRTVEAARVKELIRAFYAPLLARRAA